MWLSTFIKVDRKVDIIMSTFWSSLSTNRHLCCRLLHRLLKRSKFYYQAGNQKQYGFDRCDHNQSIAHVHESEKHWSHFLKPDEVLAHRLNYGEHLSLIFQKIFTAKRILNTDFIIVCQNLIKFLNLKPIFLAFILVFYLESNGVSPLDHDLTASICKKGHFNFGRKFEFRS